MVRIEFSPLGLLLLAAQPVVGGGKVDRKICGGPVNKANGHALLAKSGVKRGGRGKKEL